MAIVAPLAGAALGGVLAAGTSYVGLAMSAGWLVGSWLYSSTQKPDVFDSGAEEMPTFNQALRGADMAVLFGTNRVSSHVVWQKNFNTIRSEGGGGGKSGGSGAKGSAPSQTTYEYKWDLMFHMGMSDEELTLYGGWLIADRIDAYSILAISQGGSGASVHKFFGFINSTEEERGDNTASLNFESAFYHSGAATGSGAENWDHFETEEGGAYRWPSTVYVGFKQLSLGSYPSVPIITWEVGPGNAAVNVERDYLHVIDPSVWSYMTYADAGTIIDRLKGRDGKYYVLNSLGSAPSHPDIFRAWCVDDETSLLYTQTQARADLTTKGVPTQWGIPASSYSQWKRTAVLHTSDDGDYIMVTMAASEYVTFLIHQIDENGAIELKGYYSTYNSVDVALIQFSEPFPHLTGEQKTTNSIAWLGNRISGADFATIYRLPSISDMITGLNQSGGLTNRRQQLQSVLNVNDVPNQFEVYAGWTFKETDCGNWVAGQNCFIQAYKGSLLGGWKNKLTIVYDYPKMKQIQDTYATTASWTDKNIYDTYGIDAVKFITARFEEPANPTSDAVGYSWIDDGFRAEDADKFKNGLTAAYDFSKNGYQYDLTTRNTAAGYQPPSTPKIIDTGLGIGAFLLTMNTPVYNDTGVFSNNDWGKNISEELVGSRVEFFLYNPINEQYHFIGEALAPLGPKTTALPDGYGWPSSTSDGPYMFSPLIVQWDRDTGKLWACSLTTTTSNATTDTAHIQTIGTLTLNTGGDLPPPYIIYKILTSDIYGAGFTDADIDMDSYANANLYCISEQILVSRQYRREEGLLSAIDELLGVYGGFLTDTGGKIKFGLQEFTQTPVRTIDNDHLRIEADGEAPVVVTKGARQDTFNRIKVNYFDRNIEYKQNFVELSDDVDQDINGVRPQEFPAKFVMSEGTALKIATRALWGNLYARDSYNFKLGPKDADLEPGDVITLVDSHNPTLSGGKQVRIVQWAETDPLAFNVTAVDEIEYINSSTNSPTNSTEASSNPLFASAAPPAYFAAYELPKEFQGAEAKIYTGYRQQTAAMGARLYASADGVSYSQVDDVQPFIISGIMAGPLPTRGPGYVEENVEVYLMPDTRSGFSAASPVYGQDFALDDVSNVGRAIGTSAIWINSEMMAYEGTNLIAQNHYRFDRVYRGWGGTHIQNHSSGDTWWKQGGGVFTETINEDRIGTLIYYKVQPYNFAGVGYNISSIDARTYTIQGTYWRPQNPPEIRTFVQSPGSYLTIQSEDLGSIQKKEALSGGSPVQFEWGDSSRASGFGIGGYGVGDYGRFSTDTNSTNWRVEVLSSDLSTVVRCTTVSTTAFNYGLNTNSEDFNGWNGNFAVRVTPFNEHGDALRSRTKILELFA